MSRFGGARHSTSDLAYGEEPQRWDRDRFERYRRGPAPGEERETFRFTENDRPGRQEIRIEDRIERGPPPRRFADTLEREREREPVFAEDRYGPPARPRRSDRDLFESLDPYEVGDRQLAPYRRKSIVDRDFEFARELGRPRPGLVRRQSSLDTFDRRPLQRERDEYRIPAGVPIPLPIRRRSPSRGPRYYEEDEYEETRRRDYSPHDYRDVEIMREKTVRRRRRSRAKSDIRSVASKKTSRSARSSSSSSSSASTEQVSRHSSPSPERKVGKKGKTRMPKRLVRKQAVIDLGYPFEEEEDFIVVQRALDKEHIDEVIRISEHYKESKTKTYRYDEFDAAPPPPPAIGDHYEHLRTEWINPPSVRAPSVRAPSPARSSRTRRSSPARTVRHQSPPPAPQPQTVYIREPAPPPPPPQPIYIRDPAPPPPPPQPIYIRDPAPPAPPTQQPLTIVMPEHRHRDHNRDVHAEIRALEAERAALRLEREAEGHRELVLRRPEETGYEVVEYRERRPDREVVEYVERARSPKRDVVRIEKDRKGRMALVRSAR